MNRMRDLPALVCGFGLALALLGGGYVAEARMLLCEEELDDRRGCQGPMDVAAWIDSEVLPVPRGDQPSFATFRAQGSGGWALFRAPFPRVPVWTPPGTKRVGIQAGHWQYMDAPDELADLRRNPGTSGGGKAEWEVNLDIAERTAEILRQAGVEVDILPVTVPVRYRAHVFVTIHADGDVSGSLSGFKVTRPGFSSVPEVDDALVDALNHEYQAATGLRRQDNQISARMLWYYAFNARRYQHAVAPGVPQAIVETGFLTSSADRRLLIGDPDRAARGIAAGILKFLHGDQRD